MPMKRRGPLRPSSRFPARCPIVRAAHQAAYILGATDKERISNERSLRGLPARPMTRRARLPTGCARKSWKTWSARDHIVGPDGALTRMLRSGSLGSLIFWGPPGTGKTTVARLLARGDRSRLRADLGDLLRRRGL